MTQHFPLTKGFACPHATKAILAYLLSLMNLKRQRRKIKNINHSNPQLDGLVLLVHKNQTWNAL